MNFVVLTLENASSTHSFRKMAKFLQKLAADFRFCYLDGLIPLAAI